MEKSAPLMEKPFWKNIKLMSNTTHKPLHLNYNAAFADIMLVTTLMKVE